MTKPFDTIIIGGGVMGCSAAYYLAKAGQRVLLLEQFAIDNRFNASQDYNRAFHYEYGEDEFYIAHTVEALKLWRELEQESGRQLYIPCGALLLGQSDTDHAMKSYRTLTRLGYEVTLFSEAQLRQRYPQFRNVYGVLDHHGGMLSADQAVRAFYELARQYGAEIREHCTVTAIADDTVTTQDGQRYTAGHIIIAAGIWTRRLIPSLPIRPTKQQIVYLEPDSPQDFTPEVFPAFAYLDRSFYGFPMYGINAVKIANHTAGPVVDTAIAGRPAENDYIDDVRHFLGEFVPALANATAVKSKICPYDTSPDKDFIIDWVNDRQLVLGGFSGHGFKFAPLIGTIAAELATKGKTNRDISRWEIRG